MVCGVTAYVAIGLAIVPISALGADSAPTLNHPSPPSSFAREGQSWLLEAVACIYPYEEAVLTDCLLDRALNRAVMDEVTDFASERGQELFGEHFQVANRLNWSSGRSGISGDIDIVYPVSFAAARDLAPDGRRYESNALFFQLGMTRWVDDGGTHRDDLRYGMVRRFALSDVPDADVLGLSAMFQQNRQYGHGRFVTGIDYAGRWGSGWLHHYMPTTGWRPGRFGLEERTLGGRELGLRVTPTSTIDLGSAFSQWEDEDGFGRRTGSRIGIGWRPHPWLTFRTAWSDTAAGNDSASFGVKFSMPLGGGQRKPPRWEGLGLAGGDSHVGASNLWHPMEIAGRLNFAERPAPVAPDIRKTSTADCRAGQTVSPGERCTYPGTALEFTVHASGGGQLGFVTAGNRLKIVNTTINDHQITFVASRQGDGNWLIERVADNGTDPSDTAPRLNDTVSAPTYTASTAISPLTLPVATGGDGTLSYTLTPAVPGLTFDPATRRLSGTPAQAGTYEMTYRVSDADANTRDSDSDSLTFAITVQAAGDFAPRMYRTVASQTYTADTAIFRLTLPRAFNGNGALRYTLTPAVPGLTFDPATRQLSGTPTEEGTYEMTYRAADADANTRDSDTATRTFTLTVQAAGDFAPRMYGTVASKSLTEK